MMEANCILMEGWLENPGPLGNDYHWTIATIVKDGFHLETFFSTIHIMFWVFQGRKT